MTRQRLGIAVNRKRVLRVMRERKLIQRRPRPERRKRPGFFRVERPRQLWQLDMTSIWVAEHGWTYLNAIMDCCTREIVAWDHDLLRGNRAQRGPYRFPTLRPCRPRQGSPRRHRDLGVAGGAPGREPTGAVAAIRSTF